MRTITRRQTDTATYAADSTIATDLEREGLITQIDFTVEMTPSATLTAGHTNPDPLSRLVQNLRVVGGSHTFFNLPADDGALGGALLHYMNVVDGFGIGHPDGSVTAQEARAFIPMQFVLHCGVRPRNSKGVENPFDMSGFIPAFVEAQLRAEWTTSGND